MLYYFKSQTYKKFANFYKEHIEDSFLIQFHAVERQIG